jgi:hypothetical protein
MKFKEAQKKAIEMFESPDFFERIREEDARMLKQLPLLKKINTNGFLTQDSQAGKFQKGISIFTKKPFETHERAYLTGFIQEEKAGEFLKKIALKTDKNAIYIPICDDALNIPSSLDIPLTITKSQGKVEIHTHMSSALPSTTADFFRKQAHLSKSEKVVYIFCWDPLWNRLASGRNGLFTDILHCL